MDKFSSSVIATSKLVQSMKNMAKIVGLIALYSPSERQQFLRLWFLFRERAIGQCAWARAYGTRSVKARWRGNYFFEKKLRMDGGCLETTVIFCFLQPPQALAACARRDVPLWCLLWISNQLIVFRHFINSVTWVTAIGLINQTNTLRLNYSRSQRPTGFSNGHNIHPSIRRSGSTTGSITNPDLDHLSTPLNNL